MTRGFTFVEPGKITFSTIQVLGWGWGRTLYVMIRDIINNDEHETWQFIWD